MAARAAIIRQAVGDLILRETRGALPAKLKAIIAKSRTHTPPNNGQFILKPQHLSDLGWLEGLEPSTFASTVRRSNQMS